MPAQERTEEPSERRREDARRRGQTFKSQDVTSAAVLLAALLAASSGLEGFVHDIQRFMARSVLAVGTVEWTLDTAPALILGVFQTLVHLLGVPLCLLGAAALLSNGIQAGGLLTLQPMAPRWERINPMSGLGRLFSMRGLVEIARTTLKTVIIGWVAWTTCRAAVPTLITLGTHPPERAWQILLALLMGLAWKILMASVVLAVLDYSYQRHEFERNLRMTRQEVRDEHRQSEGDPHVRGRIRERQRRMSQARMLTAVPHADVVVTNPEHVAVALVYRDRFMHAPRLLAKGSEGLARRIKDVARRHDIPILEQRELARAIFATVEVGQEIPRELYTAVAHVIAWLYDLKKQ